MFSSLLHFTVHDDVHFTYYTEQVLIYHGALDIICHFPGAQEMLATTNWKGKEEFHKSERKALWLYNEVEYTP